MGGCPRHGLHVKASVHQGMTITCHGRSDKGEPCTRSPRDEDQTCTLYTRAAIKAMANAVADEHALAARPMERRVN